MEPHRLTLTCSECRMRYRYRSTHCAKTSRVSGKFVGLGSSTGFPTRQVSDLQESLQPASTRHAGRQNREVVWQDDRSRRHGSPGCSEEPEAEHQAVAPCDSHVHAPRQLASCGDTEVADSAHPSHILRNLRFFILIWTRLEVDRLCARLAETSRQVERRLGTLPRCSRQGHAYFNYILNAKDSSLDRRQEAQ